MGVYATGQPFRKPLLPEQRLLLELLTAGWRLVRSSCSPWGGQILRRGELWMRVPTRVVQSLAGCFEGRAEHGHEAEYGLAPIFGPPNR